MGSRTPLRRLAQPASYSVDLAFAVVICVSFVYLVGITADGWFYLDDWGIVEQAGSLRGIVEPYNGHLSVAILGIYRLLAEAFGFAYGPYRVVGFLCLLAIPVLFHVTTRRYLGTLGAAVLALSMLSFSNLELRPSSLNHYLVVVGGIGCAAALNRGPRADWVLAGMLGVALCGAGGGSAVAAACLVHNVCVRPPLRRWLAVVVPLLLWVTWYLLLGRTGDRPITLQPIGDAINTGRAIAWTPFEHWGQQSWLLATALLLAYIAYGAQRLRQGREAAANFVAWTAGLIAWCAGLGLARGPDALINGFWQLGPIVFRYQLVTLAFVLLALVPRTPHPGRERSSPPSDRVRSIAAGVFVLAVAGIVGVAVRGPIGERADAYERKGWEMRSVVLELRAGNQDRFPVPGLAFAVLTADELLALLDRYGSPSEGAIPLPSSPEILAGVSGGDGQATVSWTAPEHDGGSAIVGYVVTPYSGFIPYPPQTFASSATTQTVIDLTNGVTYRFKVQAINAVGRSGYSKPSDAVTPEGSTN